MKRLFKRDIGFVGGNSTYPREDFIRYNFNILPGADIVEYLYRSIPNTAEDIINMNYKELKEAFTNEKNKKT